LFSEEGPFAVKLPPKKPVALVTADDSTHPSGVA